MNLPSERSSKANTRYRTLQAEEKSNYKGPQAGTSVPGTRNRTAGAPVAEVQRGRGGDGRQRGCQREIDLPAGLRGLGIISKNVINSEFGF